MKRGRCAPSSFWRIHNILLVNTTTMLDTMFSAGGKSCWRSKTLKRWAVRRGCTCIISLVLLYVCAWWSRLILISCCAWCRITLNLYIKNKKLSYPLCLLERAVWRTTVMIVRRKGYDSFIFSSPVQTFRPGAGQAWWLQRRGSSRRFLWCSSPDQG